MDGVSGIHSYYILSHKAEKKMFSVQRTGNSRGEKKPQEAGEGTIVHSYIMSLKQEQEM